MKAGHLTLYHAARAIADRAAILEIPAHCATSLFVVCPHCKTKVSFPPEEPSYERRSIVDGCLRCNAQMSSKMILALKRYAQAFYDLEEARWDEKPFEIGFDVRVSDLENRYHREPPLAKDEEDDVLDDIPA
ncbi:MAG: hypothetical protein ACYCW6_00175 [Candidatus Xenobia bacterium]